MKKYVLSVLVPFFLITMQGCKDDDGINNSIGNPALYAKWKIVSSYDKEQRYLVIKNDNTYYFLVSDTSFGIRNIYSGVCQITSTQINFGNSQLYNYTLLGDNLTLSTPNSSITAIRDDTAPSELEWVVLLTPLDSIDAPAPCRIDFGADGQNLVLASYDSSALYRINTTTKQSLKVPFLTYVQSVEGNGSDIWCASSNKLIKINPLNGQTIFTSLEFGDNITELASEGQFLWCLSYTEFYKYNTLNHTNTLISKIPYLDITGMAYSDGYLYVTTPFGIYKVSTSTFKVVSAYRFRDDFFTGIAFNNGECWVSTARYYGSSSIEYKFYKVNLN